ncbi:MAG: DUF6094 domain-containing protein [Chloroflexota bacterium]
MPRLISIEKGGYYPFPSAHLPALCGLFIAPPQGGRLLDPCAGEGEALLALADGLKLTPYANELDNARGALCKQKLPKGHAITGDMYQLRTTSNAYSVVWCNPPYTWDSGDDKRREFAMLKLSMKWVAPSGFMLWAIYAHQFTDQAALYLAQNASQVEVWAMPGLHLETYQQIVVVAKVGQPTEAPPAVAVRLMTERQAGFSTLPEQPEPRYKLPTAVTVKTFLFTSKVPSVEAVLDAITSSPELNGIQMLLTPPEQQAIRHPVIQPKAGQLGLVLAAGMFNGLVVDTPGGKAAVRSTIVSEERLDQGASEEPDESNEHSAEKEVYRTQPTTTITLLDERGTIHELSGDGALVEFIQQHKPALLDYIDRTYTPLYTFDYTEYAGVMQYAKHGRLYETQRHVIAACATALKRRKGVILVGTPGTGKTIMAATLAAALQGQMKPGQVDLVICPPHLVEKWQREAKEAAPNVTAKILTNAVEVSAFMKAAQKNTTALHIGIMSREAAKAGEGWAIAVHWHNRRIARWGADEKRPVNDGKRILLLREPHCPTCGALVDDSTVSHAAQRCKPLQHGMKARQKPNATPAKESWLARVPHFCTQCGQALWQDTRTFSKPKKGNTWRKNPRVPLAKFIATRYPHRVHLLIADELHECKSAATDQGEALSILANAAHKVIGLTGTLYGGQASTIYAIEYLFNPAIRRCYPWGSGINRWVRDMGVLERIVNYKPSYDKAGVYTGKRRIENKPKEAPGCSPSLVAEILDHCVFVDLPDIGRKMPDFEEIPVPITPDTEVAALYTEAKQVLGQYLFKCKLEGDASALGMYLQTLLSWPSAPYRSEACIHRKRLSRDSAEVIEIPAHTIPALDEGKVYAKEQWLLDTLNSELAEGRGIAIFCRQTGTRDIQPRLEQLIRKHVPLAKPFVLHGSVEAAKREAVLERQVEKGVNVLVCNPILVQTGLDLINFPTLVFFEPMYSLYVMGQASRRAWRLIQDKPCKTYYPFYTDLMEHQAVELVGRKTQAANLLYGNTSSGGLSEMTSGGGGSLLSELAKSIQADASVTDLSTLFARATAAPVESAWAIQEPVATEPEQPPAQITVAPLIAHSALVQPVEPTLPKAAPLPVRIKQRRKRARSLLEAPDDSPFSAPKPTTFPKARTDSTPLPLFKPTQLSLF